jgi:hypothetical protein
MPAGAFTLRITPDVSADPEKARTVVMAIP